MHDDLIRVFGKDFRRGHLKGFVILLFAFATITMAEFEKFNARIFERALPVSERVDGVPIYLTGKLAGLPVGSNFIKSGPYLRINQHIEVFAWTEILSARQGYPAQLAWVKEIPDPISFRNWENQKKPKAAFKLQVQNITPDLEMKAGGRVFKLRLEAAELLTTLLYRKPELVEFSGRSFSFSGKNLPEPERIRYRYESDDCAYGATFGCHRIGISILPAIDGEVTVIGDLLDGTLIPFNGKMIVGAGDLSTALTIENPDTGFEWAAEFIASIALFYSVLQLISLFDRVKILSGIKPEHRRFLLVFVLIGLFVGLFQVWYATLAGLIWLFYKYGELPERNDDANDISF